MWLISRYQKYKSFYHLPYIFFSARCSFTCYDNFCQINDDILTIPNDYEIFNEHIKKVTYLCDENMFFERKYIHLKFYINELVKTNLMIMKYKDRIIYGQNLLKIDCFKFYDESVRKWTKSVTYYCRDRENLIKNINYCRDKMIQEMSKK